MYKKTQFGWLVLWFTLPLAALFIVLGMFFVPDKMRIIFLIVPATLLMVLWLFKDLTVSVDDQKISVKFGIGVVNKNILLADVASCTKVRNAWWLGWGIRIGPGFTLYNIDGLDAVEISFKDGRRKVRIGTAEPDELCAAIQTRLK